MAKKAEKDPDRDKNGIAYTKIQRRRMMKRVKCGLPPVPTQQEENERRRERKLEEQHEKEEWADMIHQKEPTEHFLDTAVDAVLYT